MDRRNNLIKWFGGLLAAGALALASCTDEEFVRTGGTQPDEEGMNGISADVYRPGKTDNRFLVSEAEGSDMLRVRLSQAARQAATLTLAVDAAKVESYNTQNGTDFEAFPAENVAFVYEKTIAAGAKESADLTVDIQRGTAEKGRYLLPVTIEVAGLGDEVSTLTYYYVVLILEPAQEGVLDPWDFKVVSYVNTETMQPIIATKFSVDFIDQFTGDERRDITCVDIVCLRPSKIVRKYGSATLELGEDLQYVLDNREQYVVPVQKLGRKVLVCINGGFRNLSDAEIEDLVYRIKYTTDKYDLDGVNFLEMDAAYREDEPALDAASYSKLIKATKEALGTEKLVTVACDAESTADLAEARNGIEAGQYIDYAWCGIIDQLEDPYNDAESVLKPIAGLEQSKWGSLTLNIHDTAWQANELEAFRAEIAPHYWQHPESHNVFAIWDAVPSRSGIEWGVGNGYEILFTYILSDVECIYDGRFYMVRLSPDLGSFYGAFSKDW
ncbi:MAG: DUF1735 domain-containing protein [Alistipes onderdonkii]|jgi:hypothetical protein|uniref:BT_3987 domain-containing protein n=1 Tax=Alistipes onderdonkii TaxID=328813 RepID=UPI001876A73B|nr:DUF1735 domain-containing protein [Alistipes onderdonkii]MBE5046151.1 DUF1735 domain-containing protein [Alistipes onderdonkii]MEE0850499.1 DUF1735 domain-containing protein [Alistipes onderdonkii]